MLGFLKVFGKGVLYTILFPFIVLIWVLYTVYCIFLFIVEFFRSLILWIKGGSPFDDTPEDAEAKRILLAKQNQETNAQTNDQYKDALIATLASAVAAQSQAAQQNTQQQDVPTLDVFPTNELEHEEPSQIEQYIDEKGDSEQ